MYLREIRIENFRSLKDVHLKSIDDLTILIGENGSGKTSFFEALDLFFNEYDHEISRSVSGYSDLLWFDRDTSKPIKFEVVFDLSPEEVNSISSKSPDESSSTNSRLRIARNIKASHDLSQITWETISIRLGNNWIVKSGKLTKKYDVVIPEGDLVSAELEQPTTTPETPSIQAEDQQVSPTPPARIDPESVEPESSPQSTPSIEGPLALESIATLIATSFQLIPSVRHQIPILGNPGERDSLLPTDTKSRISRLLQSDIREDMRKASQLTDAFNRAVPDGVVERGGTLQFPEGDIRFPIELIGGGIQEFLGLLLEIVEGPQIVAIEEPEIHLHPRLESILLGILKEVADDRQILVATHSRHFIDESESQHVWAVRRIGKISRIERISAIDELAAILDDIGYADIGDFLAEVNLSPSDVFQRSKMVLVDSPHNKALLPLFSRKLGIDFQKEGIPIEPLSGMGKEKYHHEVWETLTRAIKTRVSLIIGEKSKSERDKVKERWTLFPDDAVFAIKYNSLLDCIPPDRLKEALRRDPFRLKPATLEGLALVPPVENEIGELLKDKKKLEHGWMYLLAKSALEKMDASEIPEDVQSAIGRAHRYLQ